jgi:hypothetical protein
MEKMITATKPDKPRASARRTNHSISSGDWTPEQRAQIAQRAYHLFLERGGQHGYHLEDWLRAEAEMAASAPAAKPRRARAAL